ncbi:hypothetical protein [Streptomyces sp. NPDC015130]|uniref:hypothetical protein n=1 Tax=Streptomyces sp. NPDC015130 TaxID=3364940 RepID=UPI0036FC7B90
MALNSDPRPLGGADDDGELLPCGRSLENVWEGVAPEGQSPEAESVHHAHCPHCSAALADLRSLDRLITAAREVDASTGADATDGYAAAEALTARVMDVVRLELRPGRTLPLGGGDDERSWIFESAAARELRAAVDALPGIRAGSCRIHPLGDGGSEDGAGRGPLRVQVAVVASLAALPDAADEVRDALFAAADRVLGMDVREIDVRIVDVLVEDVGPGPDGGPGSERSVM